MQMNLVHSADEPADVVREMAILLESDDRRRVIADMIKGNDLSFQARQLCIELTANALEHDLDLVKSFVGLRRALTAQGAEQTPLAGLLGDIEMGLSRDWQRLKAELLESGIDFDLWDLITLANHLTDMDVPGLEFILPSLRAVRSGDPRAKRFAVPLRIWMDTSADYDGLSSTL